MYLKLALDAGFLEDYIKKVSNVGKALLTESKIIENIPNNNDQEHDLDKLSEDSEIGDKSNLYFQDVIYSPDGYTALISLACPRASEDMEEYEEEGSPLKESIGQHDKKSHLQ